MLVLEIDAASLKKAVSLLRQGGVIVYPTDTAYGLGCDATNEKAVKRIYKIKKRPAGKPLPVIVGSLNLAKKFFKFSKEELRLARKYWPGPLSLVLNCKSRSCKLARSGLANIVVRVPDNEIARQLSSKLKKPIISTSANISGKGECYSIKEVLKQLSAQGGPRPLASGKTKKNQPDVIIDGKKLKKRKPSTIIQVVDRKIITLREGAIKV